MASLSFFPPSPNTKGTDTIVRSCHSKTPRSHHIRLAEQAGSPDQPCSPQSLFSSIRAEALGSQHLYTLKGFIKFFLFSPLSSFLSSSVSLTPSGSLFFLSHPLLSKVQPLGSLFCTLHTATRFQFHCCGKQDSHFPTALKQTSSRLGWLAIEIYPKWKSCLKGISSENTFQKPLCLLWTIPHMKGDKEVSFQEYCHVSYGGKNESIRVVKWVNWHIFGGGGRSWEKTPHWKKRTKAESWSLITSSELHLINWLHTCLLVHGWLSFHIWKSGAESSLERSMSPGQISWRLQNFSLCTWALDRAKQASCFFSTSSQRRGLALSPPVGAGRPPHCDLGTDLDFGSFLVKEKASGSPRS